MQEPRTWGGGGGGGGGVHTLMPAAAPSPGTKELEDAVARKWRWGVPEPNAPHLLLSLRLIHVFFFLSMFSVSDPEKSCGQTSSSLPSLALQPMWVEEGWFLPLELIWVSESSRPLSLAPLCVKFHE